MDAHEGLGKHTVSNQQRPMNNNKKNMQTFFISPAQAKPFPRTAFFYV